MKMASKMEPATRAAVRRLDVEYAMRYMIEQTGRPFRAARSDVTGQWMTAEEVTLVSLHKMRTTVGSKRERIESTAWLRQRGLNGLYEAPLADN